MITSEDLEGFRRRIQERAEANRTVLEQLRQEVRPLQEKVCPIRPRFVTAVALVAADGGFNQVRFDLYLPSGDRPRVTPKEHREVRAVALRGCVRAFFRVAFKFLSALQRLHSKPLKAGF